VLWAVDDAAADDPPLIGRDRRQSCGATAAAWPQIQAGFEVDRSY
jgi:hypothetical protein